MLSGDVWALTETAILFESRCMSLLVDVLEEIAAKMLER